MIQDMVSRHRQGYSLERDFYVSETIYRADLEKYWGANWIWAGHISQIPEVGDFLVFEFGQESIIIVRDSNGDIRAHLNVCRHRGSRVCLSRSGNTHSFVCPYHAWTYGLDGQLRAGRLMPDGFDKREHGLMPVSVINYQGLLFFCLAEQPPSMQSALDKVENSTVPFSLANLKVAHEASYPVAANWKLALENYLECYHCAPAHKEYSKSHSLKDPLSCNSELVSAMEARSESIGLLNGEVAGTGALAEHPGADVYYRRYPLYPGYDTGSMDGRGVSTLLGNLSGYDGGASDLTIGPLNSFLIYSDHMVGYRFIPGGVQQTEIQTVWLVNENAQEGVDYELKNLVWLWDVTTRDDERIIRHNQAGVNSLRYSPGPLSKMEWGIQDFHFGYLNVLGSTC